MTTTTDLSPERLDALERYADSIVWQNHEDFTPDDIRTLIAMARAKQSAERRVSRLEKHLSLECSEFEEAYQAALAGRDEGYAMAQAAERERDEWKTKFEAVRQSESDALAMNDALTFIARTNGFERDKAVRERDALREALKGAISMLYARDSFGDTYCRCCKETAGRPHSRTCATGNAEAALAQPTTGGGE